MAFIDDSVSKYAASTLKLRPLKYLAMPTRVYTPSKLNKLQTHNHENTYIENEYYTSILLYF